MLYSPRIMDTQVDTCLRIVGCATLSGIVVTPLTLRRILVGLEMHQHIYDPKLRITELALDSMTDGVALDDR